jgi:pyruvate/2-oxoglutarate/acetoin dehydrogenase E1 component
MSEAVATQTNELTYIQAVNEALRWGLTTYPEAILFGEDVAIPGGPYGASRNLLREFRRRVFDTPISEAAMVGAATGAAMRGLRPILEIMYVDFTLVAFDQIVNQLANVRYVSRGAFTAPVTIRTQQGVTPGTCAQHTQSLEAHFAHTPGLHVGLPANPADAYEMLRSAIADPDPVLIIEHRALYGSKGTIPLNGPVAPVGGAHVVRGGRDATLVSWSRMVHVAAEAADVLASRGIMVDLIDLRWLAPLDMATVVRSLERTGRLVIAHEAHHTGGYGAEIAARVAGEAFWALDAPIERVATPDIRMPAAANLQEALLPGVDALVAAVERTLQR